MPTNWPKPNARNCFRGPRRDHNVAEGWSVVVKGVARILHDADELAEAERAQLLPWTSTVKQHYVRIRPLGVTGRRFVFGAGIVR
ncbi:pyridoxamine 5'-phosphate oxidase family protein [Mycobacterium doricum]|nr:pyridoxamine 5'-phosphate oxidase family protein [Mycolicibacterium doricum]